MQLVFNDQAISWCSDNQTESGLAPTLSAFLHTQKLTAPFAVAINRHFVPKTKWCDTKIQDGDNIEILQAVTGG